ncbi:hypothetical protein INT46_006847 [Mucor plumbeus]|uniref:Homeobox domain-containing protein n=1 Tax=Mucor plumbeus TaxID=97098 RepID=A0A8H7RI87_9FUNG|nr:hypothetical protein INT46_006847 [Mucor plumbeus]
MVSKYKKRKRAKKSSFHGENKRNEKDELKNEYWLPKIKRRRRFSSNEIRLLETEYKVSCNPSQEKVEEIAEIFSTDKKIIITWFQNRRAKNKKLQSSPPLSNNQEEGEDDDEEHHNDLDNSLTEMFTDNTTLSNDIEYYDSDTINVINGDTALMTPTFILHQQEHQNILSALNDPHYTDKHIYDYFSNSRHDLYYYTKQEYDQDVTNTFFTSETASSSLIPSLNVNPEELLSSDHENDSTIDSPLLL